LSVLVSNNAGADGKDKAVEFSSYCNKCEFTSWCDKKHKPFMLQSTIEANELYNEIEDSKNIDLDELPEKIYELKKVAQRTLNNIGKDKK
jgi:hypothetical protein